jgi:3-phosphoshikimate 1-carboxyvinyltransferase
MGREKVVMSTRKESIIVTAPFGVGGKVSIPGSKSISNRALLLAALASGTTRLSNVLRSDDTSVMLDALKTLGIGIEPVSEILEIKGRGGDFPNKSASLFLGNAGTAVRTLVPVLSVLGGEYEITGVPRMHERPIGDLVDALRQIKCNIDYVSSEGFPPLRLHQSDVSVPHEIVISGSISSQFLSGLLLALPLVGAKANVRVVGELVSKPYVALTLSLMKDFGVTVKNKNFEIFEIAAGQKYISPGGYDIEADASSASYFLAAAALGRGLVRIENLSESSIQGDIAFIEVLAQLGVKFSSGEKWLDVDGRSIEKIKSFDLDLNHIPDAAMTLAVMALFADGPCKLRNIENWRVKETDRLSAMATELRKFGAQVREGNDFLEVIPSESINDGVTVETYDDHRIAMCFSLLSFAGVSVEILDPQCVNKTFPNFFDSLEHVTRAPVVSIDGPSGVGKGTIAVLLAKRLGFHYLDSGALYRVMAFISRELGVEFVGWEGEKIETWFLRRRVEFQDGKIFWEGKDISQTIRSQDISDLASRIASNLDIRKSLINIQKSFRRAPGLVAEGRDMGSVVFPDSCLKIFLSASLQVRAERRYKQLISKGFKVKIEGLAEELEHRDKRDESRDHSPLRRAEGAVEVDTSTLSVEEVFESVVKLCESSLPVG